MADENKACSGDELVWEEVPHLIEPIYKVDERPEKMWETLLYGWQHTLIDMGTPLVLPIAVSAALKLSPEQSIAMISATLFVMGISTLFQATFGNRLPVIQGPCSTTGATIISMAALFPASSIWAAIFVCGFIEFIVGATGLLKYIRVLFPMVVAGLVITCIGLNLGMMGVSWVVDGADGKNIFLGSAVILLTCILKFMFPNFLRGVISRGAILFSILIVGLIVAPFVTGVNWHEVAVRPWFAFPEFFPYGHPFKGWTFMTGAILGLMVAIIGSVVEMLGDFAATSAVCGVPYRVSHMNKGVRTIGLCNMIAPLLGSVSVTSYSQNSGLIANTRIASRFVIQVGACFILLYGLCPKFAALLAVIPQSVQGGVFVLVCCSITVAGLELLHTVPQTDGNKMVTGLTLLFALGTPLYFNSPANLHFVEELPMFARLLLSNSVVLAVVIGTFLNVLINHIIFRLVPCSQDVPCVKQGKEE